MENNIEQNVLSFQRGEEKGLAWFFRELYPSLTLYCNKITANKEASEEIASNAFIKIWQRHERFSDFHSVKAYLYRIVRNDAFKYLHSEKRRSSATAELHHLLATQHEKDHFATLVKAETTRELLGAVNTLPAQCSKVFKLMYVDGRSVKETAHILQLSPSTVKTQKKRGVEALRKHLLPIMAIALLFTA